MYYTVYKTTNNLNGKYYIGAHKTTNLNDNYLGSGVALKSAIRKYGVKNFSKEVLFIFDNSEDMYLKEAELVNPLDEKSYNLTHGGKGGWDYWNENNVSPLKDPKIRKKLVKTRIERGGYKHPEFIESSIRNLSKAIESNTGKVRPEHSKFVSELQSLEWDVIDPAGRLYNVKGLKKFCENHNLPYSTLASKCNRGKIIKCGKAKGWVVYNVK